MCGDACLSFLRARTILLPMGMKNSTHKRIALVVLTKAGLALALRLQRGLATEVDIYASQRACKAQDALIEQDTDISITSFDTVAPLLNSALDHVRSNCLVLRPWSRSSADCTTFAP